MPRGLRDEDQPAERFEEWMAILRDSNASQFNLLHLAYRVMPFLGADMSQTGSTAMVVDSHHAVRPRAVTRSRRWCWTTTSSVSCSVSTWSCP